MSMPGGYLPYGRQSIDQDDIDAVVAALKSDYLTTGPTIARLEDALASAVNADHVCVCANGTAGLHLAMLALGVGPGDAVVVPSLTFLASANAVRYVGAEVCFADVDPDTGMMTVETFVKALETWRGASPKVAVFVHLGGQVGDLVAVHALAAARGIAVVEDACHALGATYTVDGETISVGSCRHSTMAVFSMHPVKAITMGEGGAVTCADPVLARRLREFRSHGMVKDPAVMRNRDMAFDGGQPNPWYYEMHDLGFNMRATDFQCALGLSQLRKLPAFIARRQQLADIYDALLQPLAPVVLPPHRLGHGASAWHLYAVRVDFAAAGLSRRALMLRLQAAGIGSQVHYIPVHRQPYYQALSKPDLPGADLYYDRTLSLPLFPAMSDEDPVRVVDALAVALGIKRSG